MQPDLDFLGQNNQAKQLFPMPLREPFWQISVRHLAYTDVYHLNNVESIASQSLYIALSGM
jgi:hypothetical protein